ncbi:MAG: cupin domain-containing protein [Actinomycetota bacterium]
MPDVTVKRLDDFEAVFGGGMRRVRSGLGVTSFGMQVIELPANFSMYPDHDHSHDEQEEVYLALGGRATLKVGEEEFDLEPGVFARVGPGVKRKLLTGEEGARILCLGGTPGRAYEAPEWTEEGGALPPMPGKEAHSASAADSTGDGAA